MTSWKRKLLEALVVKDLEAAARRYGVRGNNQLRKGPIVEKLARSRDVKLEVVLERLSRARLLNIFTSLGLEPTQTTREGLIQELLRGNARARRRPNAPAPPRPPSYNPEEAMALIRACYPDVDQIEPVKGWTDYYVTNDGRVLSTKATDPRVLGRGLDGRGMHQVTLSNGPVCRRIPIAHLVAGAFNEIRPSKSSIVLHRNGDVADDRATNLVWSTRLGSAAQRLKGHRARAREFLKDPVPALERVRAAFPEAGRLAPIEGFDRYVVDDRGSIYSTWNDPPHRMEILNGDAMCSFVAPNGERKAASVGNMVARAFLGPPPDSQHRVRHKNGNPNDNRIENLVWSRWSGGGTRRSAGKGQRRLSDEAVRAVRFLLARGESKVNVQRIFGLSPSYLTTYLETAYDHVEGEGLEGLTPELRSKIERETRWGAGLNGKAPIIDAIRQCHPETARIAEIAGFDDYFISDDGTVFSTHHWPICPPKILEHPPGRHEISLRGPSGRHDRMISELVAEAFLGPRPARLYRSPVRHLNGDVGDCRAENLAWRPADQEETPEEPIRAQFPDAGRLAPIPDWPGYCVSDDGRVYSTKARVPRILDAHVSRRDGTLLVILSNGRAKRNAGVAYLVAAAFVPGRPPGKAFVRHKNGDRGDNCADNLEWSTTRSSGSPRRRRD
ncbi:MAG: HNH endonuclease [Deltaproteobacteria bacterium]|nr:HNH endonuclease [Deltaproteobacteria bacterium]